MRTDTPTLPQRRRFLKDMLVAGGLLALVPRPGIADTGAKASTTQGYRLTKHIQTYYRTLRV